MYYPKRYDQEKSIELSHLIIEAYKQYDLHEQRKAWEIPNRYKLISELFYNPRMVGITENSLRYFPIRNLISSRIGNTKIPIGYIAERGNDSYIVFRGTQTPSEWLNNMNIKMEPFPDIEMGSIHEGFLKAYLDIRENVLAKVLKIGEKKKIYITGHSLGGAFAYLAAADIKLNGSRTIKAVYTFGSPRIGDKIFATTFNSLFPENSFRVYNTADVVTEIPFSAPVAGIFGGYFAHTDIPVVFTEQQESIEINHSISKYAEYLETHKARKNIIDRILNMFA